MTYAQRTGVGYFSSIKISRVARLAAITERVARGVSHEVRHQLRALKLNVMCLAGMNLTGTQERPVRIEQLRTYS